MTMAQSTQFFFFYSTSSPFSQHHASDFVVDGVQFNCAEQYMMYSKAALFHDEGMKEKILSSLDPKEQKRLGRKVQNFDQAIWNANCEDIVRRASLAKFQQNEELRKELIKTFPKTLVEASPTDTIWGIGLSASNPKAQDKKTWRGQNKLGYILTEVRDRLMEEKS
ncbi:hypothetical protein Btru_039916 [Bulinus truncatus]|nr:hypothetical protein Btru_039916 [Bulinus truncatus]